MRRASAWAREWQARQMTMHFAISFSRRASPHDQMACDTFLFGSAWWSSSRSVDPHHEHFLASKNSARLAAAQRR